MICVYTPDCTDFSGNGIGPVSPLSCTVTETLNGEWELTLEHPLDDAGKWRRLVEGCILRAPVPAAMTPQVNLVSQQHQTATHGDDAVPQLFQQGRFLVERRQQPQPFGLSQRDARVRLEGQHDAFAVVGAGLGDQPPDQGAVAQVHAVVRPDGDRRTDEVRKCVETVKYPHLSPSPAHGYELLPSLSLTCLLYTSPSPRDS